MSEPRTRTKYVYDAVRIAETTDGAGNVVARYAQGQNTDEPLAMQQGGTTAYYQADGLGSVTSLANSTGALISSYTYDSFGNLTVSAGTLANPFRYTAREFDSETGFYYYRARYYDSISGRFSSEDPIRFDSGQPNFYPYVGNNPIGRRDPFGLDYLNNLGDFSAGAGDTLSLGLTYLVRKYITHTDQFVNKCSGFYTAGIVTGSVIGVVLGDELASQPNTTQLILDYHDTPHPFGPLGELPHIQLNVWTTGIKGSGWALRIPLPW